jgi:sucrose-6-phosphate hydrolase SacC (GH32 family)
VARSLEDVPGQAGRLHLRLLVDIGSIEVFGNHGQRYMTIAVPARSGEHDLGLSAAGSGAVAETLALRRLGSAFGAEQGPIELWSIY